MSSTLYYGTAAATILVTTILLFLRRKPQKKELPQPKTYPLANVPPTQLPPYIQELIAELPGSVTLQSDVSAFQAALDYAWAQQNREIIPACVVKPRDTQQLSAAVKILGREHARRVKAESASSKSKVKAKGRKGIESKREVEGESGAFFAIRSGGLNPGLGVATIEGGTVIDLSLFNEVIPAEDGKTVTVGTGAKWIDVYKKLDEKGLIVMGGRNSPVGVGGLTLQGGISFYSPRHGFVCSAASSYTAILASGSIITISPTSHPSLFRALKGAGTLPLCIVTSCTLLSFPAAPLWSYMVYTTAFLQHNRALKAYSDYLDSVTKGKDGKGGFDENSCGPILSFVCISKLPGVKLMALNLTYTKVDEPDAPSASVAEIAGQGKKTKWWPSHWRNAGSGFKSLWAIYSETKIHSHTFAIERFGRTAPYGTRHVQGCTTILNNLPALQEAYSIFCATSAKLRPVKGLLFAFTHQTILPGWYNRGYPNMFGLEDCTEALIIMSASITWDDSKDDGFVRETAKQFVGELEEMAERRGVGHRWRFLNYSMEWQDPFKGFGEENLGVMREVSEEYDPDGLFQRGSVGAWKIPEEGVAE